MATNRMSRFEIFIGVWNTSGEVFETEGAPATTLSATDTYRWLPGKHFIAHDADARFGGAVSRSTEVIGYDNQRKKHVARSYDDHGVSEEFEVKLQGRNWSIIGDAARFHGKFDAKYGKLTGLWELRSKRVGWQPWIDLTLVRA